MMCPSRQDRHMRRKYSKPQRRAEYYPAKALLPKTRYARQRATWACLACLLHMGISLSQSPSRARTRAACAGKLDVRRAHVSRKLYCLLACGQPAGQRGSYSTGVAASTDRQRQRLLTGCRACHGGLLNQTSLALTWSCGFGGAGGVMGAACLAEGNA